MKAYNHILIISLLFCNFAFANSVDKTKNFKVAPGGELILSVSSGEVRVTTWEKNEVQVTVKGLYDEDTAGLRISQEQNSIRIRYNGGMSDPDELMFVVQTPIKYNQDIRTLNGDITITGNVKGTLKAFTNGGDIKTGNIDGITTINTQGGDITTGDIFADAELSTSGGDIFTGKISGNAEVITMGGDITVSDILKKANIKTHGGDIRIGNTGGDTEAFTFGGDVIVKLINGNCKLNTHGGDIKIDGAKGKVTTKSNGGDIKLLNVVGAVEANTASGDIIVELTPDNTSNSKISTHNGSISLNISEKAKAEIIANVRILGSDPDDEDINISSEFKPESHEKNNRKIKNVYILNGGGVKIDLESTNSGIKIKKLIK